MKTTSKLIRAFYLAFLAMGMLPTLGLAQVSELEVGPTGSNQVLSPNAYSAAIGEHNYLNADNSLVVGLWNTSMVNYVGDSNSNILTGAYNYMGPQTDSCVALGFNNFVQGEWLYGYDDPQTLYAASVLGFGLINKWSNSTIVGQYNNSTISYLTPLLFAVGNGASSTLRSNALEVYVDGTVKIVKRQGDILMGEFGNP
jgi:hypothetical protein